MEKVSSEPLPRSQQLILEKVISESLHNTQITRSDPGKDYFRNLI